MFDHETNRLLREILEELQAATGFLAQIALNTTSPPQRSITGFTFPLEITMVSLSPGNTATFSTKPIPATSAPIASKIVWTSSDTTNAPVSPNPADPTGLSVLIAFPTTAVVGTSFTLTIEPYTNSDGTATTAVSSSFTIVAPPSPDVTGFTAPVQIA